MTWSMTSLQFRNHDEDTRDANLIAKTFIEDSGEHRKIRAILARTRNGISHRLDAKTFSDVKVTKCSYSERRARSSSAVIRVMRIVDIDN